MADVVRSGFRGAVSSLALDPREMPLSRWNESVLRNYFCRAVALADPEADQFVECGEIASLNVAANEPGVPQHRMILQLA
jgi:hypothetical protein